MTDSGLNREKRTTCPYCGVGCGVVAQCDNEGQVQLRGDEYHPANQGKLCSKGLRLGQTLSQAEQGRLLYPRVKGRRESWPRTMAYLASRFNQVIEQHGPDSVAFYVSGQLLTEDYYLANKLMKGFIGSGNIDTNSRLCMSSAVAAHKRAFGSDTVANSYRDLERADLILLVGSNLAWCHPVLYQRILAEKARRPDMKLVVIDPRRTASCEGADLHLQLRAGQDITLFNGLLHYLDCQGKLEPAQLTSLDNLDDTLSAAAQAGTPEQVARAIGVTQSDLLTLFQWFAATPRALSLFSMGINQSSRGVDQGNAIINCHLAMGHIGKIGAGAFSITGQPNAMGGREVGGLANTLAAHMEFGDSEAHDRISRFWQTNRLASQPGYKAVEMFDAIADGRIKAIWIMGTNPAVSLPERDKVVAALEQCPLVVVSDCVAETDTLYLADVVLPALAWGEKEGSVTNSERRISRQRAFLPSPGEARADWWIITQLARAMGFTDAFAYHSVAEVFREHAALSGFENQGQRDFDISALAELSDGQYDSLGPLQWPQPAGEPLRMQEQRLFADGRFFTANGRARLVPVAAVAQEPSKPNSLRLNTGRWRDQWHTMTRTAKAPTLNRHCPEPRLLLHPDDAAARGIEAGNLVRIHPVSVASGEPSAVTTKVTLTDQVRPGETFLPMHWNGGFASSGWANALVQARTDVLSGQPGFKQSRVMLEPLQGYSFATVLCRRDWDWHGLEYWVRQPVEQGQLVYLAHSLGVEQLLAKVLQLVHRDADWQLWQSEAGAQRSLVFSQGDRIELAVEVGPDSNTLQGDGLAPLLSQPVSAASLQAFCRLTPGAPDQLLCVCRGVTRGQVRAAIDSGAGTVDGVSTRCGAGAGCGSCRGDVAELLRQ